MSCKRYSLALFLCLFPSLSIASEAANPYLLGPLDQLRIKAFEWRSSRDEVVEWKALNDQFTIGSEGELSLPFVGQVSAKDLTTSQLGERIAAQMQRSMGFARAPSISIEVVKFRPFYITGDVRAPGEFPSRPGITVLQAVSLAGGYYREAENIRYFQRESIIARGELRLINVELLQHFARRSRLEAELNDAKEITFPDELLRSPNDPPVAKLLEQEKLLFGTRRASFVTELKALEDLRLYLKNSTVTLDALLETQERQLNLAKKEFSGIGKLADKGLATASRSLGLQRDVAQLEGDRLRVLQSRNNLEQELAKTELAIIELRNKRVKDVTVELSQTQAKIDALAQRHNTNERLLMEIAVGAAKANLRIDESIRPAEYSVVRRSGSEFEEILATENTIIRPGDTVKVTLPSPLPSKVGDIGLMSAPSTQISTMSDGRRSKAQLQPE